MMELYPKYFECVYYKRVCLHLSIVHEVITHILPNYDSSKSFVTNLSAEHNTNTSCFRETSLHKIIQLLKGYIATSYI